MRTALLLVIFSVSFTASASPSITGGLWGNYRYITDSDFTSAPFNE
ncbi:hypothetical protein [Thiohalomonas denitrificans]|nr:hypothetical protein [Thiohalomonas denitrificans]